jgi:hypothetical protein
VLAIEDDGADDSIGKGDSVGKGDSIGKGDSGSKGHGKNKHGKFAKGSGKTKPGKITKGSGKSPPSGWCNKMICMLLAIEDGESEVVLALAAEYSVVPSIVDLLDRARAFMSIQADTVHKSTAYCNGGCTVSCHTKQLLYAHMQTTTCVV